MSDALDLKVFVPTRDHARSIEFYQALGWTCNWRVDGLAELELAGVRLYFQDFYAKEWADNFMIYIDVDDVDAWYERARDIVDSGRFEGTRAKPLALQPHGDIVANVWDPCSVLLHFAQKPSRSPAAGGTDLRVGSPE